MKRASIVTALAALLVSGVLFASGYTRLARAAAIAEAAKSTEVTIDNFSFTPGELTVAPGTTVTWVNKDDVPHTIVSNDGKFKSQALDTDEKFSFAFSDPGTYEYYCSVHPKMTAKVIVK